MIVLMRVPMPAALRDRVGIDDEEAQLLVDDLLLHLARQLVPDLVGPYGAFSRKTPPGSRVLEHVEALEEVELVAGDERRLRDQVRRADRPRPEAQVRDRHRAGLLRVVDEVALRAVVASPRR